MKPRLHAPHRGWFLAMAEQLKDVYLVQPFGHVRGWFSDLKHQDDCELTRHRNDVRLEQNQQPSSGTRFTDLTKRIKSLRWSLCANSSS